MRPRIEISVDEIVLRGAVLGEADVPAFRQALTDGLTALAGGGAARPAEGAPEALGGQVAGEVWARVQRAQP